MTTIHDPITLERDDVVALIEAAENGEFDADHRHAIQRTETALKHPPRRERPPVPRLLDDMHQVVLDEDDVDTLLELAKIAVVGDYSEDQRERHQQAINVATIAYTQGQATEALPTVAVSTADLTALHRVAARTFAQALDDDETEGALGRIRAVLEGGRYPSTPGTLQGAIVGDNTPPGGVMIDTRRAILLEQTTALIVTDGGPEGAGEAMALGLGGRVNRTQERADVLILANVDGAAQIVNEITKLAIRVPSFGVELFRRINDADQTVREVGEE